MNAKPALKLFYLIVLLFFVFSCDKNTPTEGDNSEPLLTDKQLVTPEDPDAPEEDTRWVKWIKENYIPVRSLSSENFSDLRALEPLLANKRIVQLGESGHGVAEFSEVKVRLIKFLHEELGFDVIAFESSIFECFYTNDLIKTKSSEEAILNSIFRVWYTSDLKDLFSYLRNTLETDHPLILAGFDVQISSATGARNRPAFFKKIISKIDPEYAGRFFDFDSVFVRNHWDDEYLLNNKDSLVVQYTDLTNFFNLYFDELVQAYRDSLQTLLIARQTALSMPIYIEQRTSVNEMRAYEIRDKGMADNLEYLMNEIYPEKKIIVWAHNAHIRHDDKATKGSFPTRNMGSWLAQRHRNELYTIGLYMYRGSAASVYREIYDIQPSLSGSLESIFYRIRKKYSFVDISRIEYEAGNSWMFKELLAKDDGLIYNKIVLKDQYDAILFIDTVSPPDYLPGM